MSSPRGLANHHLYLARLVLAAWQRDVAAAEVPASTLAAAFGPACQAHLLRAYGWFLLAVSNPPELPATLPGRVADLPSPPEGRAISGELREFEQLEKSGWLAELLAWQVATPGGGARRSFGNLASGADAPAGPEHFGQWAGQLEARFARMGDALDEY
ncbi:DUF6586 family protein [Parahaliea mediterranea]|uniref:DUF6586 family protein n=1 Tax=Parahaliea mediterranea TaxID=651086 RepID=UPI000E2F6ECA|nr:DUF6586 family protein [Parahaliea mediterranea]